MVAFEAGETVVPTLRGDPSLEAERIERASIEADRVERAIRSARDWLLAQQESSGSWCAPLSGDSTLESYLILLEAFLGRRAGVRSLELARALRAQMLPDGGWSQYPGGPAEISVSCLSYFALKLAGDTDDSPHLERARAVIHALGGPHAANTYTKYHLALFGQYSWSAVPAIPPEMMYLPRGGPFTIYDMSSWSRTIFVPLAILYAHKPVREIPSACGVSELFDGARKIAPPVIRDRRARAWRRFFFTVDRLLKRYERVPGSGALRRRAVERAAAWMIERLSDSEGLSAILPAMCNSVMALNVLGYAEDHPLFREQLTHLDGLLRHDEAGLLRVQPCLSPVWDTVLSCHALIQSGTPPEHEALARAATWLLSKQTQKLGDWAERCPGTPPGGFYFEYKNEFYPDVDDTSMALIVLAHARADLPEPEQQAAMQRGLTWMLNMQNRDGGWGAFDRNNDKEFLTHVPFADHNAMIDPSTADITARVLECLSHYPGFGPTHPAVKRALSFLTRDQTPDGSWYGRWGVNYLYGTWQVLRGLAAIGADMHTPQVRRAVAWLCAHQNPDGGWGETIASYDDPRWQGTGESTPSQTAWGLMGLLAAGQANSRAVKRGVRFLIETQNDAGEWSQEPWSGTGFPRVFYLDYPLYRQHFPLLALSQFRAAHT